MLRLAWQATRARIDAEVKDAGYTDITHAHLMLFRWRAIDGMRPTELADEIWISKQALNDLLRDLEDRGYLRREIDEDDRRGRVIRLTQRGWRLFDTALVAARRAERDLRAALGPDRFSAFKQTLEEVVRLTNSAGDAKRVTAKAE